MEQRVQQLERLVGKLVWSMVMLMVNAIITMVILWMR